MSYTAQVRITGEIHTRTTAALFGSATPVSLLRETLTISAADAKARLAAASMTLPQTSPTGLKTDPVIPELTTAMGQGAIGTEQIRTIVSTITTAAARRADPGMLEQAKKALVDTGKTLDPKPFAAFAAAIANTLDLDGHPDKNPADRVQLTIGTRNPETGSPASQDDSTTPAPNSSAKPSKASPPPPPPPITTVPRTCGPRRSAAVRHSKKSSPGI